MVVIVITFSGSFNMGALPILRGAAKGGHPVKAPGY